MIARKKRKRNKRRRRQAREDSESTTRETIEQCVKQRWDCSQAEIKEEEDEFWQNQDQMDMQWAAKSLEQRRMEGISLKAEAMQKVLELMVHERVSQVIEGRGTKEKQKSMDGLLKR